jgi:RNA polymerase sigma factor (sigma-70 family)
MPAPDQPSAADTEGDTPTARAQAIEAYIPQLYRLLVRRLRGTQDAKDLLQDVYVRFLAVPRREKILQPERYLYRIAINLASEYSLRQKKSRVVFDSEKMERAFEVESHGGSWLDDPGEKLDVGRGIQQALNRLPPMYRTVLLLWGREGLSPADISAKLGLTLLTTRKYLSHAIAELRVAAKDL